jgi:hypothetical protein
MTTAVDNWPTYAWLFEGRCGRLVNHRRYTTLQDLIPASPYELPTHKDAQR